MKKTYSAPRSASVDLYAEEALLSVSGGSSYYVDANEETEYRWSQQRDNVWGNNSNGGMWSNMDK